MQDAWAATLSSDRRAQAGGGAPYGGSLLPGPVLLVRLVQTVFGAALLLLLLQRSGVLRRVAPRLSLALARCGQAWGGDGRGRYGKPGDREMGAP